MYQFLSRNGQTIGFLLGLVVLLLFVITVSTNIEAFNNMSEEKQLQSGIFDFGLKAAIGLGIVAALIAVAFGIIHLITNLKGSVKFLIAFIAIIAIFFITYSSGSADMAGPIKATIEEFKVTEGISKFINGGIITTLILAVIAAVTFCVVRNI